MKLASLSFIVCASLVIASPLNAQASGSAPSATGSSSPALSVASIGAAVTGSANPSSIVLTGTVVRDPTVPGRPQEPIWLQVDADGKTQMKISSATGATGEVRPAAGHTSACTSTQDANNKPAITAANCWSPASWILPTVALANSAVASTLSSSVAASTKNGNPALQLNLLISTTGHSPGATRYITVVTARTVYLNPQTLLPFSMTYSEHPGNNTFANIPVEVLYSDYRTIYGVTVPFHIAKTVTGHETLDITIQQVIVNH